MTDVASEAEFSIDDLPFSEDRARGWRELRERGEVVRSGEQAVVTSAAAADFVAKRPEIFSSARAFDRLGSPVPMVPIAIDPPDHTRFRRLLDPF
ncbi:MAG: cytochrome P450, partial [Mycobacterium sp.]